METLKFLTRQQIDYIAKNFKLPVYVYSETKLREQAKNVLGFPNTFGLVVRYAMKANSNINILKIFNDMGLWIDASSEPEVYRALNAGIPASHIQLTSQRLPENLSELLDKGISYNATSLYQLEEYGKLKSNTNVSIRINTGIGSGFSNRTNTGGPGASFGIWYEYIPQIENLVSKYGLNVNEIHTHLGVGTDPTLWLQSLEKMFEYAEKDFPNVQIINMGGGLKLGRMSYEKSIDIQDVGNRSKILFEKFYEKTSRKLSLRMEPGTYMVANCGSLICKIQDITDTGKDGYKFLKINAGMTEVTRPAMYGSQHPIFVINDSKETDDYIVVGHCCESGDILTPESGDPEGLKKRTINKASIGDSLVIDGAGAYCSAMSTKNYNSYPTVGEIMIKENGDIVEIRKREILEEIWKDEIDVF